MLTNTRLRVSRRSRLWVACSAITITDVFVLVLLVVLPVRAFMVVSNLAVCGSCNSG